MKDQSDDWAEYAFAQKELNSSKSSNDRHWGLEYALDKILDDIKNCNRFDRSDVERRIQTGSRRNRYRSHLLRSQSHILQPDTIKLDDVIEARSEINFLRYKVDSFDLIEQIAQGFNYHELAMAQSVTAATLRKRVSRARRAVKKIKIH